MEIRYVTLFLFGGPRHSSEYNNFPLNGPDVASGLGGGASGGVPGGVGPGGIPLSGAGPGGVGPGGYGKTINNTIRDADKVWYSS